MIKKINTLAYWPTFGGYGLVAPASNSHFSYSIPQPLLLLENMTMKKGNFSYWAELWIENNDLCSPIKKVEAYLFYFDLLQQFWGNEL